MLHRSFLVLAALALASPALLPAAATVAATPSQLTRGPVWWVDHDSGKVVKQASQRHRAKKQHRYRTGVRYSASRAARAIPSALRAVFALDRISAKPPVIRPATIAAATLVVQAHLCDGTVITSLAHAPPVRPGVVVIHNLDGGTREFPLGD